MPALPADIRSTRALLAIVCAGAVLVAGCGDGGSTERERRTRTKDTGSEPRATPTEAREAAAKGADSGPSPETDRPPARVAIALGRQFDALVAAYAPVSARVNFVVAANTLRRDAQDTGMSKDVVAERTGVVRVEVQRMRRVLLRARRRVASVRVADPAARAVQASMVEAIDRRGRALDRLDLLVDAEADATATDAQREQLEDDWRASWDGAFRSAREATTTMQDAREATGLEPALEESIR